jgi:serine phosphatase RsbU (regulator of sigma subunit)
VKLYVFISLFILFFNDSWAKEQYLDKSFYLIDSIPDYLVSETDYYLLDSCLKLYHLSTNQIEKLIQIQYIVEECWNDNLWPKYNKLLLNQAQNYLSENEDNSIEKVKELLALALNNEGYYYKKLGNITKALDLYEQSLKIDEEINNLSGVATTFNNLAAIYNEQGLYDEAISYFEKSLLIHQSENDSLGISLTLNNIGSLHYNKANVDTAMSYFQKSLTIDKNIGNVEGAANTLNNLGFLHKNKNEVESAFKYFEESLSIYRKISSERGQVNVLCNMGTLNFQLKNYRLAKSQAEEAFAKAQLLGYPSSIKDVAELLFKIYQYENRWQDALNMHKIYVQMKDSIINRENKMFTDRQQIKYEYEKQRAIEEEKYQKELLISAEINKRQKIVGLLVMFVLFIVAAFTLIILNRLRITKKQKNIIEEQKELVEEKNMEILDSIYYAKRIQQAVLKSEDHQTEHYPEHFVLFKPKDIVSGDFYWAFEKKTERQHFLYLAVADCTGHGVPGALMSMLGMAFLNDILNDFGAITPAEILNKLRARIIKELGQTGEEGESKDGMDISLCRLGNIAHSSSGVYRELQWAGANNPLWLVRKNSEGVSEFVEVKPNKQPIGHYDEMTPFTNHDILLNKNDVFYLFSDGFADQFGGQNGKKLKSKAFKELLLDNAQQPHFKQKEILDDFFNNWKGNFEQIDDVCIIGVRI